MAIEDVHLDVLQNIEFAIVSEYRQCTTALWKPHFGTRHMSSSSCKQELL